MNSPLPSPSPFYPQPVPITATDVALGRMEEREKSREEDAREMKASLVAIQGQLTSLATEVVSIKTERRLIGLLLTLLGTSIVALVASFIGRGH